MASSKLEIALGGRTETVLRRAPAATSVGVLAARAALPVLVLTACGGTDEGRLTADEGEAIGATDDCAAVAALELSPIGDFDSGAAEGYFTNSDRSEGSTFEPPVGVESPDTVAVEGGRCGEDTLALHIEATGLDDWGGVFGRNFNGPTNVSEWTGLGFWGRRGGGTGQSIFASVAEQHTAPGEHCESEPEDDSLACDRYGLGVGFTDEWRFYTLPFDRMRQRGFGVPAPFLDVDGILGLNFEFGPGDWDLWIDDIGLYR